MDRMILSRRGLSRAQVEDIVATEALADPMTTAGDLIRRSGANATERLAVGTEGHVLSVVSGLPAWAAAAGGGASVAGRWPGFPSGRFQASGLLRGDSVSGAASFLANRAYLLPVPIATAETLDSLTISVATGSAGVTVRLGVQPLGADGLPSGAPLVDAGTVDAATSGNKTISALATAVTPGWVGLVLIPSGAISLTRWGVSGMPTFGAATVAGASASMAYDDLADNSALPNPFVVDGYEATLGPPNWWMGF